MKNRTIKSDVSNFSNSEIDKISNSKKNIKSNSRTLNTYQKPMIAPPDHVWDRIEKILDKQDSVRKHADDIIAASFGYNTSDPTVSNLYLKHRI